MKELCLSLGVSPARMRPPGGPKFLLGEGELLCAASFLSRIVLVQQDGTKTGHAPPPTRGIWPSGYPLCAGQVPPPPHLDQLRD